MSNPETRLTNKIRKALMEHDATAIWVKIHGGPSQRRGVSDLVGCYRGRFVALEVKVNRRSEASPAQRYFLNKVSDALGYSAVVRTPEDALEVIRLIDEKLDSLSNKPARNKRAESTDSG